MIVVIGEILIDIFPNYARIGGAPFNFAYHLKQLGFTVRFLTRVGQDEHGRRILDRLDRGGFNLDDVQIDSRFPTGTVRVDLDEHGVPHFDICENVAYDHLDLGDCEAIAAENVEMIYFGSLLQRTESGHGQVQDFLSRNGKTAIGFCDINMRPPHVNNRAIADSLQHADLLKLNEDELVDIQRTFNGPAMTGDIIGWLMDTFKISTVALTRGSRGSTLYGADTETSNPGVPGATIVDTVGAGDGYAAILAAGYLRKRPLEATIRQASRFAAQICGIPGAVPDDAKFYDEFQASTQGDANE